MGEKNKNSFKVQAYVEKYTNYVLTNLIGIKGKTVGDVVSFIIKDWIGDHAEELEKSDITVAKWKNEKI